MNPLFQLVYILSAATLCQLLGWRLGIPSIMFLLVLGILSGPVFELLSPDYLLGPSLLPLVELAVAVILFEGGLSLKITEVGLVKGPVSRLISIGAIVTWALLSLIACSVLELTLPVAALLSAILTVSGPTVVIPLLRTIRAKSPLEPILRWEGILIDPIGVLLAIIVAEIAVSGLGAESYWTFFSGMTLSLFVGSALGWLGASMLKFFIGRHKVSDHFIIPVSFSALFIFVTLSNMIHEQSGLLTSTIMGMLVARSKGQWVHTLEDFIGNTQRMFIGILFMVLAARLDPAYLKHIDYRLIVFIALAILVVRPIAVFVSTFGTKLSWKEKTALGSVAPRGIVSAALASSLGTSLADSELNGIEVLVPYTFATIILTVTFYSIFSSLILKLLKLQIESNEGVLFVSAGKIPLAIGKLLNEQGFKVAFVDTNTSNIRKVKNAKLSAYHGNVLSEAMIEDIDFDGIGNLLAFTPNDEANSLAATEYRPIFETAHIFQVSLDSTEEQKGGGRLFGERGLTFEKFEELWEQGFRPICRDFQPAEESADQQSAENVYLLAQIEKGKLYLNSWDNFRKAANPEKEIILKRK